MTANRGPQRANRRRAAATGETYTQARQARLIPPAGQADDYDGAPRDEERARHLADTATRRYQEAPVPADVFLRHVKAQPDLMPVAPTKFAADDMGVRRDWGLPCLRCGQPSANTYVTFSTTSRSPHWLDLCRECIHATGVDDPTDMAITWGPRD